MYTFHIVSWRGKFCYRFLSGSISCGNSVREAKSGLQSSSSTSARCLWLYWNHGKEDDLRYDERGVRCKLAIHRRSGRNSACAKKSGRVTRKGRGKVHVSWTAGETRGASLLAAGNYATIFYPSDSALLIINFNIFGVAGAFVAEEQFVDPVSLHIWSVDYEK